MVSLSDAALEELVRTRNVRGVARLITLLENAPERARAIVSRLYNRAGRTHIIGVTGAPGAGKSTLVDALAVEYRKSGASVAIVAVDPTSPFSGGAILGDRIRMNRASEDPDIFIRSMATRGSLGGLSRSTVEAVTVFDSAGFDVVIIETVGVGQAEVDIMRAADSCVVVLVPGMGDGVQIMKAGLMEIADLFVINKSDYDGANLLERDILGLLSLAEYSDSDWKPPIVKTVAHEGRGVVELFEKSQAHRAWLTNSEAGKERKRRAIEHMLVKVVIEKIGLEITGRHAEELSNLAIQCVDHLITPYKAVEEIERLIKGTSPRSRKPASGK